MRLLSAFPALLLLLSAAAPQDSVRAATTALTRAIKDQDRDGVEEGLSTLGKANSDKAMQAITRALLRIKDPNEPGMIEIYWDILGAAATFTDAKALEGLTGFILRNKRKPVSRDMMAAVCSRGHKELVPVCVRLLKDGPDDLKMLAAEHLGAIGDRGAFEELLEALKRNAKGSEAVKRKIGRAMTALTGKSYGGSLTNWEGWWSANKNEDWDALTARDDASSGNVTDTFDAGRYTDFERLKKTGKVLILKAGDKCKCGKNHDLDNIDQITEGLGLTTDTIDKVEFEKSKDLKLDQYVAVLANCTFIRQHCVCPMCRPSKIAVAGTRAFQ